MGCDYYIVEQLRVSFDGMRNPFLIKWRYERLWGVDALGLIEKKNQHTSVLLYENGEKKQACDEICEIVKSRILFLEKDWEDVVSIHLDEFVFERY